MNLLVGLGNYGKEYENTRHNYGFLLIDKIISTNKFNYQGKKFKSDFFVGEINDYKIIAIKPETYMNLSGISVAEVMNFFKIPSNKVIVFHDDLDLAFGKIKYKIGGGNGGHNGLKSIDEKIGVDYARIRLGIGKPIDNRFEISNYVLSKFSNEELNIIDEINNKICKNFHEILRNKVDNFLNNFHLHQLKK